MSPFNQSLLYTFIVFLSIFYQLTYSQSTATVSMADTLSTGTEVTDMGELLNDSTSTPVSNISISANTTTTLPSNASVTSSSVSVTTTSIDTTTTNTVVNTSITASVSTNPTTTTVVNTGRPSDDDPSGPGWWLLVALLITIFIVVIIGFMIYYRRQSPYRRFLRNWRSREDDTDNIVLQLEQSDASPDQWPPRISFS